VKQLFYTLVSIQKIIFFMLSIPGLAVFSQTITGDEILKKVDRNMASETKIVTSTMIIHGRRESRTVEAKSWQRGTYDAFTEYLAPAREKGTKMLKLKDMLWTYSPSSDRTIMISQHMLRQSVMGSDLSYEDMMEDPRLPNLYNAGIATDDTVMGRQCWVLDLSAKKEDIAYDKRKVWVDKARFVILKEHLFAKSGKLLKTVEVIEMGNVANRWMVQSAVYKDVLKEGKGTEFHINSIEFDATIPDHIFTKASLRR